MNKPDHPLDKEYHININQVGIAHDDLLGETHQKFGSIHSSIKFNPVGEHENSGSKAQIKLLETKEKPQRRHGFDLPLHPQQIATFILFGYNILMFYIVIIPSIVDVESPGRQALAGCLGGIYVILIVGVIKYTYETTIIDPTDKTVYLEREAQLKGYDQVGFDIHQYEYLCNICKTHVLEHTKHCQQCNRCVQLFDHHCPWLNNCIGVMNYKVFIKMLVWVTFAILYQEICALVCFHLKENFQPYSQSSSKPIWVLLVVSMVINFPVLLVLIKLLSFHIYLIREGQTTYQYILSQRERATNQKQQSKVILQVKQMKDDGDPPNIDIFKESSPRYSSDDADKQKTKDMSDRNQFIREHTPPMQNDTSIEEQDQYKCSLVRLFSFWNLGSPKKSDKLPRSIKVKPINELVAGGSNECLPRSQSHLSAIDDDGPVGADGRYRTHQQSSQIVFTSKGYTAAHMSNRSKTSKYDPNNETQENNVNADRRLKTQMNEEETLKLPMKTGKKTVIAHQNHQGMDVHAVDAADSYRYSNKYEDILRCDQFKLESKTSQDRLFKGRTPLQERIGEINKMHLRKPTLQETPLIENNASRLSMDPSILSSVHNANLKQVLSQQLNQNTQQEAAPPDRQDMTGELARKNSRNFIERGNSDLQSITSKKRQPYEHKSLA